VNAHTMVSPVAVHFLAVGRVLIRNNPGAGPGRYLGVEHASAGRESQKAPEYGDSTDLDHYGKPSSLLNHKPPFRLRLLQSPAAYLPIAALQSKYTMSDFKCCDQL
jgi:hypothetical protein